jgi:hypothetical protein
MEMILINADSSMVFLEVSQIRLQHSIVIDDGNDLVQTAKYTGHVGTEVRRLGITTFNAIEEGDVLGMVMEES